MNNETTIFISVLFELVGLNKGRDSVGLSMISTGLLWLSWQLMRLGKFCIALYFHTGGLEASLRSSQRCSFSCGPDECGR
jgi:hypothetical protein